MNASKLVALEHCIIHMHMGVEFALHAC